jgi:hypothetical protein
MPEATFDPAAILGFDGEMPGSAWKGIVATA